MNYELSDVKRVKLSKGLALRFTFTIHDSERSFSIYGCLAGINREGLPWAHPPRNNSMKGRSFEIAAWNKPMQESIISALWDVGLSDLEEIKFDGTSN